MTPTPIIVTRGGYDIADATLPLIRAFNGCNIWDNSKRAFDLKLLAAYFAADESRADLIFYQDDDLAIAGDPWDIVRAHRPGKIVCNMPPEFQAAYANKPDALMGFGSVFERALIRTTWARYRNHFPIDDVACREAHRIFTGLNRERIIMVDVPKENMPYATDETRLWKQADHGKMAAEAYRRVAHVLAVERGEGML